MVDIEGLPEYSKKLKSIRVEINDKFVEIRELESEKSEIWEKLLRDFNDNKIFFKKQEGLNGLDSVRVDDVGEYRLVVTFTSNPSAKGLSIIEENTGLTFYDKYDLDYMFKLI